MSRDDIFVPAHSNRFDGVRPEGLEPPTTWFEARYSVQLSYGRIKKLMGLAISFWGEWWDLNPRSSGPQPDVLTPTPHPPYLIFNRKH